MKVAIKYLFVFCLFVACRIAMAQGDVEVRIGGFASGEYASVEDILKYPSVTVINRNARGNTKLISYDCVFSNLDSKRNPSGTTVCKNTNYALSEETIALLKKYLPGEDFVIRDIAVEVVNVKTGAIEVIKMEPLSVRIAAKSGGSAGPVSIDYSGKLMTGKDKNVPVAGQKVVLLDENDVEIQTAITDNYGDFKFTELRSDKSYKINVLAADDTKIKDGMLFAARPDGTIIRSFNKTKKGFVYELLPAELTTLAREKEEDTGLKIKNFGASKEMKLTVNENIYYDPNSSDIKTESIEKLDKIIKAMSENTALKLAINSHTDATGEDAYNMTLSEKRAQKVMEYFILQGIEKSRLKAKGFGETQIKNRCKNGVDCSELEQQFNRRTEFNFTK